ncbi:MAG: DUF6515 family protein [Bacteroidota bacterium]
MKKLYKYAAGLVLTGALSVMMVLSANAQRGAAHASSGGSSGGGGGGGGPTFSRGGGGSVTGSVSIGSRGGFGLGIGYRSAYGYRPAYYGFGYPSLGFYLSSLPYGYYPFYMGSSMYYYNNGIFYCPYDDGYVVTAPPVGAAVPGLPKGAKSIMIDNQQFFEYNGVYYKVVINDKGDKVYVVAGKDGVLSTAREDNGDGDTADQYQGPRVGDMVNRLPDNSRSVTLNGRKYYVSPDEVYYEAVTDRRGNIAYKVASVPDNQ